MGDGSEEVCDGEEGEIEGVDSELCGIREWAGWVVGCHFRLERRTMLGGLDEKWFLEKYAVEAPRPSVHLSKQSSFESSSVCHVVDAINK